MERRPGTRARRPPASAGLATPWPLLLPDTTVTTAGVSYAYGVDFDDTVRTILCTGHWSFDWTPAAGTYVAAAFHALVHIGTYYSATDGDGLYFADVAPATLRFDYPSGTGARITAALTWSAAQTIHIEVNNPTGEMTITGATTGDGTYGSGVHSWPTSITEVTVGALTGGLISVAAGTYSNFKEAV